jgi:hypothetical protein
MIDYLLSPSFKSHLENAYYFAGIAVGLSALFVAGQYFLTRNLAKQSSQREAYVLAAAKCEHFGSVILPLAVSLMKEIKDKKLLFLDHAKVEETPEHIRVNMKDVTEEDCDALNTLSVAPFDILNQLEAFALFFETRIAAETPGFLTVGPAFCDVVKDLLPFVAALSDDDPSYEHVMALYIRWQKNRETLRLLKKRAELDIDIAKSKFSVRRPFGC